MGVEAIPQGPVVRALNNGGAALIRGGDDIDHTRAVAAQIDAAP